MINDPFSILKVYSTRNYTWIKRVFGSKAELCSFHEADHETDQAACTEIQNEAETLRERRRTISSTVLGVSKKKRGSYLHLEQQWNVPVSVIGLAEETAYDPHGWSRLFVWWFDVPQCTCARVRVFIQHYIFMHWPNERSLEGVWSVSHACRWLSVCDVV